MSRVDVPRGRLITFEGLDGAGKTTQVGLAAVVLERLGIPYVMTRQPGGTTAGIAMRRVLLDSASVLEDGQEMLIYQADRALHVSQVVEPALRAGLWVLCDRYSDSTMAYQGFGRGQPLGRIKTLTQMATAGRGPDLSVLVDVPVDVARARQAARGADRIEQEGEEFYKRVRAGYRQIVDWDQDRWLVCDGCLDPAYIAETIADRLRVLARAT